MPNNVCGALSCVFRFYQPNFRVFFEKFGTLGQGHRMGVNFPDLIESYAWQRQQVLLNAQVHFTDYHQIAVFKQFVIAQNTSCNTVLNCQNGCIGLCRIGRFVKKNRK